MGIHGAVFLLFVAATYLRKKELWYVVISVILVKIIRLYMFFIMNKDDVMYWPFHNEHYASLLKLAGKWGYLLSELFFGNNIISLIFLSVLYVYWLSGCHLALVDLAEASPRVFVGSKTHPDS
ncbi:hypothetical protein CLV45_1059 [Hymenobacter chitinivorans DSM 11115]|uniref:Uncharacterized protein n=2 Tax=Hymenobacter chitinivorans TaxID=89969 RepID=A0A2M9BNW3_9BACT|nr:hypothetical protein CLV45_1059 [Hymenobacter chitinivorans DSM 11115]